MSKFILYMLYRYDFKTILKTIDCLSYIILYIHVFQTNLTILLISLVLFYVKVVIITYLGQRQKSA